VSDEAVYRDLRPLLFSLAYRMLGRVTEAEDVVQEAFLRYHRARSAGTEVDAPKAYLVTVTTRLAIDELRSARAGREAYVGTWLPEPLLTDPGADPTHAVEVDESLSLAVLVVLETLNPVERAVFLLREVFDHGYDEIAAIVERSEDNCRQIAARARRHVADRRPRFEVRPAQRADLAERLLAACLTGDEAGLVRYLAEDVAFHGDGGGKAPAIRQPVHGAERVARFLVGLGRQAGPMGVTGAVVGVNGQAGLLFRDRSGALVNVIGLDVVDGRVAALRSVINPDKLGHLGPIADVYGLLGDRGRG
jgi:RNA polymerase sigma-70 factor (ECF subfamily)